MTLFSKTIITGMVSPMKGRKRKETEYTDIDSARYRAFKSAKDSSRRSKGKVYDYARANEWKWFVTLTFDPAKVDSLDYDECVKKLSDWLSNTRKKCGDSFKYLVVPEEHKSGRYHFHGLFTGCDELEFIESGHVTKSGELIYNISGYRLGFTTATKVYDAYRVALYIGKYITKEICAMTRSRRRYWQSRNCNLPEEKTAQLEDAEQQELYDSLVSSPACQNVTCKEYEYEDKKGWIYYIELKEGVENEERNDIEASTGSNEYDISNK